jgi:hypothetical protein
MPSKSLVYEQSYHGTYPRQVSAAHPEYAVHGWRHVAFPCRYTSGVTWGGYIKSKVGLSIEAIGQTRSITKGQEAQHVKSPTRRTLSNQIDVNANRDFLHVNQKKLCSPKRTFQVWSNSRWPDVAQKSGRSRDATNRNPLKGIRQNNAM